MRENYRFSVVAKSIYISMLIFFAGSVYGVEKEDLDVNLNSIDISARSHRDYNVQGEIVLQIPFALTKNAEDTGLGPIGSIVYFDNKTLVQHRVDTLVQTNTLVQNRININSKIIQSERATFRGLGRFYYVVSAYATKNTFIPYLTIYRELLMDFTDVSGHQAVSKQKALLTPGFEYAHRLDDKVVLHFDAEIYSNNHLGNNTSRVGGSYALSDKWILSASYERWSWDIKDGSNNNIFMNGVSNSAYLKLINSNPLRNNLAITFGYAGDQNTLGNGASPSALKRNHGLFWGAEFSFGTLAW